MSGGSFAGFRVSSAGACLEFDGVRFDNQHRSYVERGRLQCVACGGFGVWELAVFTGVSRS